LSLESYGRPRMTEELQELGLNVGHRRVGRLMRENSIKIVRTQKYKATTDSYHTFNIAPNLLDQDFSADGPNQKLAGDISYIWTSEGWLYLAVILDLSSRHRLGCQQPHEAGPSDPGAGHGCGASATARRLHSSHISWLAILFE
jgi:putative transposase